MRSTARALPVQVRRTPRRELPRNSASRRLRRTRWRPAERRRRAQDARGLRQIADRRIAQPRAGRAPPSPAAAVVVEQRYGALLNNDHTQPRWLLELVARLQFRYRRADRVRRFAQTRRGIRRSLPRRRPRPPRPRGRAADRWPGRGGLNIRDSEISRVEATSASHCHSTDVLHLSVTAWAAGRGAGSCCTARSR